MGIIDNMRATHFVLALATAGRPQVSVRFVLREEPNFVALREALQSAANLIRKPSSYRLRAGKCFLRTRLRDLDQTAKERSGRSRNPCPNRVAGNAGRNRVHSVRLEYSGTFPLFREVAVSRATPANSISLTIWASFK
jgi:hypothetical protein